MSNRPVKPATLTPGLPPLPPLELVVVREARGETMGFLSVRRLSLAVRDGAGTSAPFAYDIVDRGALDAAAVVAHFEQGGRRCVVLRSSLRPPLALRAAASRGRSPAAGVLWEIPAGLIEPGEAPIEAAARELNEEIGTALDAGRLTPLGPPLIPAPAMIAEHQHLFHVEIDPAELGDAAGDGSALERASMLAFVALDDALALARAGALPDAKTEVGLRRLAEVLS